MEQNKQATMVWRRREEKKNEGRWDVDGAGLTRAMIGSITYMSRQFMERLWGHRMPTNLGSLGVGCGENLGIPLPKVRIHLLVTTPIMGR